MTTAFAALLIGVAAAAVILALVAYFWVNRNPSPNERFDEYGRVPLFGVDLVASPPTTSPTTVVSEPAHNASAHSAPIRGAPINSAPVREMVEIETGPIDPHANYKPRSSESEGPIAAPNGDPIAIDNSAMNGRTAGDGTSNRSTPAESSDAAPRHLKSEQRLGGRGWGNSPGWPAPELPTPRYVPPVQADPRAVPPPAQQPVASSPASSNGNGVYAEGIPGSMVEGHRLRYSTPAEGTLQFLPGRLEIASGLDTGREIRFVRLPGPDGTEVTFGRNEGPLYRHIQLRDQTVSREHARMTLIDGHWLLTNLSKTNPVAHNGRVLGPGEHQLLSDGDRLDMGEVIFSFRSR